MKREVGGQLTQVDTELHRARQDHLVMATITSWSSRNELSELRTHLVYKQNALHDVQQTLLQERRWTYKILAVSYVLSQQDTYTSNSKAGHR